MMNATRVLKILAGLQPAEGVHCQHGSMTSSEPSSWTVASVTAMACRRFTLANRRSGFRNQQHSFYSVTPISHLRNSTTLGFSCGTPSRYASRAFLAQTVVTSFIGMATSHDPAGVLTWTRRSGSLAFAIDVRNVSSIHPRSGKQTVTFQSWDSRILAVLPPELAAEFPARLSYRSGMSTTLFSWIRSCFQNGMGAKPFSDWDTTLRSRVLKDVFHVFNILRVSSAHGLRVEFARRLRDAILWPDAEDKQHISAWGSMQNPPRTFEQIRASKPAWLWRRCKRIIPPPQELYPGQLVAFRSIDVLVVQTSQKVVYILISGHTSHHLAHPFVIFMHVFWILYCAIT